MMNKHHRHVCFLVYAGALLSTQVSGGEQAAPTDESAMPISRSDATTYSVAKHV
jgi:hypothetical protein